MGVWFHKTIIWSGLTGAPSFAESIGASRKVCLESCLQSGGETEIDRGDRGNRRTTPRVLAVRLHDGDRGGKANRRERVYRFCVAKRRKKATRAGRITAFLESLPSHRSSGIAPIGYEYREYKNWRGIPKPRRCPFCKRAKGDIRKVRNGFQGVCPNCGATGPKQESQDEALRGWNGRC
jgi:hypothetical protein